MATTKTPDVITLPAGWTLRPIDRHDCVLVEWPDHGMVTIDFDRREFRIGFSTVGRADGPAKRPTGLGWRHTLVNDAVAMLERAWH